MARLPRDQISQRFPGSAVDVLYRVLEPSIEVNCRRLLMRMDHRVPCVKGKDISELYWRLWTTRETKQEFSRIANMPTEEGDIIFPNCMVVHEDNGLDVSRLATVYNANPGESDRMFVAYQRKTEVRTDALLSATLQNAPAVLQLPYSRTTACHMSSRFLSVLNLNERGSRSNCTLASTSEEFVNWSLSWDTDLFACTTTLFSIREDFLSGMQRSFDDFVKLEDGELGPKGLRGATGLLRMMEMRKRIVA